MNNPITAIMKMLAKSLASLLVVIAVVVAGGCAKSSKGTMEEEKQDNGDTVKVADSGTGDTMTKEEDKMMKEDHHVVFSGESLWVIAEYEDIYNDPFQWPLLYKNNIDQIEDADLIYPGQKLVVRRDESGGAVSRAIEHARTRGAWFLGLIEASDQEYLRNSN